jgi:hypothetical protein
MNTNIKKERKNAFLEPNIIEPVSLIDRKFSEVVSVAPF